jgi:hypothetical protein
MNGSSNPNWKGGRTRGGEQGRYVLIHRPDHPAASSIGYVLEHRLVMETVVGRHLLPSEIVHHLNGDTTDNRPENLEVMTQAEHARLHYDEHLRPHSYVRPPASFVVKICEHCSKTFDAVGKKEADRRFCSMACYQTARRERPTCKRGHPWTPENTYVPPSGVGRDCRQCTRDRQVAS